MLNEEDLKRVLKQCGLILFKRTHEQAQMDFNLKNMIFSILKNRDNLVSRNDLKTFLLAIIGAKEKELID